MEQICSDEVSAIGQDLHTEEGLKEGALGLSESLLSLI